MKKHTLFFDEAQISKIKVIAEDIGISMSDLIRLAIRDCIKKHEKENKK